MSKEITKQWLVDKGIFFIEKDAAKCTWDILTFDALFEGYCKNQIDIVKCIRLLLTTEQYKKWNTVTSKDDEEILKSFWDIYHERKKTLVDKIVESCS
jgi:hypothetical protein